MSEIKRSYVAGAAVARNVDVTGNNVPANFIRGFGMYFDKDVKALRTSEIEADKAAFKQYLLQQKP